MRNLVVPSSQHNLFWDSVFSEVDGHFVLGTRVQNHTINSILKCLFCSAGLEINLSCTNFTKYFFYLFVGLFEVGRFGGYLGGGIHADSPLSLSF